MIHWIQKRGKEAIVLSTDAEKAFDRVTWDFMFEVHRHMGLGQRMMGWLLTTKGITRPGVIQCSCQMFSLHTSGLRFLFYFILLFLRLLAASWYPKSLPCNVFQDGTAVIVECTNRSLTAIPPQIPRNTTNLTLNINHIEEITPDSFSHFSNLVEIGFKCNCIPIKLGPKDLICNQKLSIEDGSFASLLKLRSLFLDGNQLSQFPRGLPPYLRLLSLEANTIISIKKNNLSEIHNIEMLYLGQNCYYRNPCNVSFLIEREAFKDLTQLTLLSLKGNNLSYVPGSFPVSLKELYIYNNRIEYIQEYDFQNLTNLEVLDLSGNCPRCYNTPYPCIPCSNNAPIFIHEKAFDSLQSLHTLRLQSNSLRNIPGRWFQNIQNLQVLDLSQNFLAHEIREATFLMHVPTLKTLDFSFNYEPQQYQLDLQLPKIFSSLKSLETLRIRGYVFQELKKKNLEPLVDLKNLTVLDLGTNFIKVADFSLFQNFSSLKTIALANNKISPADNPAVSSCSNFKSSSTQYNYAPFRDVHYFNYDDQAHHCKLNVNEESRSQKFATENCQEYGQMLDLSQNNIFFIRTSDFKDLSFIKCLNMSGNVISQALNGTEFASLKHLKYLDFSNNRLDLLLSSAFEELQELEILDLSSNQHYFLAEGITHMLKFTANLRHLKKLMMNWNEISTSTSYEMVSQSIEILEFKGNRLDILWRDGDTRYTNFFKNVTALLTLDISYNALTFIPSKVFEGLPANLSRLFLANNNFKIFSWEMLCQLGKLKVLDLSNNHLTAVPFEPTNCTHSIQALILSNNKIKNITPNFLRNAVSLKYLDLSFNKISFIGKSSFPDNILSNLEILVIQGNPFKCNCDLVWFVSWINSTNVIIPFLVPDVSCAGPGAHRGKSLIFLDLYTCGVEHWNLLLFSCSSSLVICLLVVCTSSHLFYWDFWYTYQLLKAKIKGYRKLPNFCYDAFIVYDSTDYAVSDWIFNELIITLEKQGEKMFNLCLEERDWLPGKPFLDNLSESIQLSRKTVFVLTDKYITSGHFKTAFYIAHQRLIDEKVDVIIFILLEKTLHKSRYLRLRKRLCGNSVLYWPTNSNTHNYFWNCLKNVLRTDNKMAYDRLFKDNI
ncbi:PREDICTED: toll-like receptor 7 [Nanorana parkeri]|uniref:toll-like receptor 7 n=1 Tax=Nanorana parkeri TaxID=125878 RepID=UPI000854AF61|nr:PREDICTED: toll-like receptor 7 [Nanorana parkeri]